VWYYVLVREIRAPQNKSKRRKEMKSIASMEAWSLFDGGWRSVDRDLLQDEYKLTNEEADRLTRELKSIEENQ